MYCGGGEEVDRVSSCLGDPGLESSNLQTLLRETKVPKNVWSLKKNL